MEQVGEHPVAAGPLSVRWLAYELPRVRAGTALRARVALENAGSAPWRSLAGQEGIQLAYHWLDGHGNPIVWDGIRTGFAEQVEPGGRVEVDLPLRAPIPPGPYLLAFDLVHEHRFWFAEVGSRTLELPVEVGPRIGRALAVRGGEPGPQEEPLVAEPDAEAIAHLAPGVEAPPEWSRRVLDGHQEGYAAVGGSVEPAGSFLERRRAAAELAPWAPGSGRNPAFAQPLLCPSLVVGVEPEWADPVLGLPALRPPAEEPWLYDAGIELRLRL